MLAGGLWTRARQPHAQERAAFDPLIIVSYSLLQKISISNSVGEGQSLFRHHVKEIPVWSALDYVGQYVIRCLQVMTLIHSLY